MFIVNSVVCHESSELCTAVLDQEAALQSQTFRGSNQVLIVIWVCCIGISERAEYRGSALAVCWYRLKTATYRTTGVFGTVDRTSQGHKLT